MAGIVLIYVCAFVLAIVLPALAVLLLDAWNLHPVRTLLRRFRALPLGGQLVAFLFAVVLIVRASVKPPDTNDVDRVSAPRRSCVLADEGNGFVATNAWEQTLAFRAVGATPSNFVFEAAWPAGLFGDATKIDVLVKEHLPDAWRWLYEQPVGVDETNFWGAVWNTEFGDGTTNAPSGFVMLRERKSAASTMEDLDGDGLPGYYELHYGRNPYVDDYGLVPKLTVGPAGDCARIDQALAQSEAFSVIEVSGDADYDRPIFLPEHPVLVTGPTNGYAIIRSSADIGIFRLEGGQDERTLMRNLYLVLENRGSFQAGFWSGGNLPWSGVAANATFENVCVRMSKPDTESFGWLFYRSNDGRSVIRNCLVNAEGANWAYGVQGTNCSRVDVDGCSFLHFPADGGRSRGVHFRTLQLGCPTNEIAVSVRSCLFDDSFTNALAIAKETGSSNLYVKVANCIVPREVSAALAPDSVTDMLVTNGVSGWSGFSENAPIVSERGIGAVCFVGTDTGADSDGDGLTDAEEINHYQTDPWLADSDGDDVDDGVELDEGSDPKDADSFCRHVFVTVTNTTVEAGSAVHVAWIADGATNGWQTITGQFGQVEYTVVGSGVRVLAWRDMDGNGDYSDSVDVTQEKEVPARQAKSTFAFSFGDIDGDGVCDRQELLDGTDPSSSRDFCFVQRVELPAGMGTNYPVRIMYQGVDGSEYVVDGCERVALMPLYHVTNGVLPRLVATNGVQGVVIRYVVTNSCNDVAMGSKRDGDSDDMDDLWELSHGFDIHSKDNAIVDGDGDGLINLHEYWAGTHPLIPDGSNTLLSVCCRAVDDRIAINAPGVSKPIYSDFATSGSSCQYDFNPLRWTANVDFSCMSVWNDWNAVADPVTLISARHVIAAEHMGSPSNRVYRFRMKDGRTVCRTLLDKVTFPEIDVAIGVLDAPVSNIDVAFFCPMIMRSI